MKRKFTTKKTRTRLIHASWLGALIIVALVFARCFEWTTIDQPSTANPNSSFDVKIVLKQDGVGDFAWNLYNVGCFGVQLPEGWTVENDSFYYNIKGILQDEVAPYEYEGYVKFDEGMSTMYEDSIPSDEDYYWWGGLSTDSAHMDNMDSIYVELTINTDDQTGEFFLQYGMGTFDWPEGRTPTAEGGLSPKVPINIAEANSVRRYLRKQVDVYPNPANDVLNVNLGEVDQGNIQLYNFSGQLLYQCAIEMKLQVIDVSSYPTGTYLLKISTKKGSYSREVVLR